MENRGALEFRNAGQAALGNHLVCHRSVCDKGFAAAEAWGDPLLVAQRVDACSDFLADQGAQVAGVLAVAAGDENLPHFCVHAVYTGYAGDEQSAAGHDQVNGFQCDTGFIQRGEDGLCTHLVLLHHIGEGGEIFGRMVQLLFKSGYAVFKEGELGGCGTCIDDQDVADRCLSVDIVNCAHTVL